MASGPKVLTKAGRVTGEKRRISQLTNEHSAHFKIIFSHQVEKGFTFKSLHNPKGRSALSHKELSSMFISLAHFMDDALKMTISEVEEKYKRPSDTRDATFDPETETEVQVEHLCLYKEGDQPRLSDSVRIHGYFRTNGGYFVVTRMDWFHDKHKRI